MTQIGPELRERWESVRPDLRERIEALDLDLRSRLEDLGPYLKARIEALDLPARLEIFRANLTGDHEPESHGGQPARRAEPVDGEAVRP